MSRRWGDVRQLGFVVRDLDAALIHWTEQLGIGPFFVVRDLQPADFRYRGAPAPAPLLSLALGNTGGLQVELIQQLDETASGYRDFLQSRGEGAHHVCSWLSPPEYDVRRAEMLAASMPLIHEGRIPGRDVRFAYFETQEPGGLQFELADQMRPPTYAVQQRIAAAARDWDGSTPVRSIADLTR